MCMSTKAHIIVTNLKPVTAQQTIESNLINKISITCCFTTTQTIIKLEN